MAGKREGKVKTGLAKTEGVTKELSYVRTGDACSDTTLIFLHGSTMTKEGMLPFARQFSDYNVVVFDLTAHGESGGEEPEEICSFAVDVEENIRKLQREQIITEQIILLGYSMGGAIACEIASRGNTVPAGIVMLSSGANLQDYTPLVDGLKTMPQEQFRTKDILGALFGTDIPEDEAERIAQLFASTSTADCVGYQDLMVSNQYKRTEAYHEITVPVLLVHGCDDQIVLPEAAIEMWRELPCAELLMLPYRGHAAIYEDTQVIREKIIQFTGKI